MTTQALATRPRRRTSPVLAAQFDGRVLKLSRRPRLMVGDLAELCGNVLPGNLGKAVIIEGFDGEWVDIKSVSGLLDSRDMVTGEVAQSYGLSCRVHSENLYRLDNSLKAIYARRIGYV